jgi:hypothetical protein
MTFQVDSCGMTGYLCDALCQSYENDKIKATMTSEQKKS